MSLTRINLKFPALKSQIILKNQIFILEFIQRRRLEGFVTGGSLSCWDTIDPVWKKYAYLVEQIYVHREIIEWMHLNKNVLCDYLQVSIKRIHQPKLDGLAYLIEFYFNCTSLPILCVIRNWTRKSQLSDLYDKLIALTRKNFPRMTLSKKSKFVYFFRTVSTLEYRLISLSDEITAVKTILNFKMPWKTNPTYFLRIDSSFENENDQVMEMLRIQNIQSDVMLTSISVNWFRTQNLQLYEFCKIDADKLDSIFRPLSKFRESIYLCTHLELYNECQSDNEQHLHKEQDEQLHNFSCWDELDPKWLNNAIEYEDDRIYVHGDVLDSVVKYINGHILKPFQRACVTEVQLSNLPGSIYLIKFYKCVYAGKCSFRRYNEGLEHVLKALAKQLELYYKMPLRMRPTYFLRMDLDFEDLELQILDRIDELNLCESFDSSSLAVNWFSIQKIQIYEFWPHLHGDLIKPINEIFQNMTKLETPIYICTQLDWDQATGSNSKEVFNINRVERAKYSCWDIIDTEWLNNAIELEDARIYIHEDILEWIVEHINNNLLNKNVRATVEEVHHHNLDGSVYLILFYKHKLQLRIHDATLTEIRDQLKYKLVWKRNPTYFLRVDSNFDDRKIRVMEQLQDLNLHKSFSVTRLNVNWLYIPVIEIYEILADLAEDQVKQIDSIFHIKSKSQPSIYICDQFKWHRNAYVEVDKVVMDMSAEEWRRIDLLKTFSAEDILSLDLANKDFRDPYYNEYLDRYLNILLTKLLPQLSRDRKDKIELPLYQLESNQLNYFVSRFYHKISMFWDRDGLYSDHLNLYDIPIFEELLDHAIQLEMDQPSPDTLSTMFSHSVKYNISNYTHFSNSLFRALLNKPSQFQTYNIQFDNDFMFAYRNDQPYEPGLTSICNWTYDAKEINIILVDCIEKNANNLYDFVKYLINLFSELNNLRVTITFVKCMLDDYGFLQNIGSSIDTMCFQQMNISSQELRVISQAVKRIKHVIFSDCNNITDSNVMTLLEHIDFNRLWIEGKHACTIAIYYLVAEYLMEKEDIDIIKADRLCTVLKNFKFNSKYAFNRVEFVKANDQITARDLYSKNILDYYLWNGTTTDDNQ